MTDDAAAFSNFALACAGKRGYIPPGTYLCNAVVTFGSNCVIRGSGMGATILKQGAGLASTSAFIILGATNCTIENLTVDGNYANNTGFGNASIQTSSASTGSIIKNVEFVNWGFQALAVYFDGIVDGCLFKGGGTTAIRPAQYGIWCDTATARVNISNCIFENISTNAIIVGGVSTITGCIFKGHGSYSGTQSGAIYTDSNTITCTITGNVFLQDGGFGLGVENNYGHNTISGNFITSQTAGGVTLEGTGAACVTGNAITGCFDGVDVKANTSNFTVSGNQIYANTHAQINIEPGSSNNYVITGNMLNGALPITNSGAGTLKTITGNTGYNPAAATGVTVGPSPFTFTNTLGFPITVLVLNGSVSQVTVGGYTTGGGSNSQFTVPHGKAITVTYSVAPSMLYMGL